MGARGQAARKTHDAKDGARRVAARKLYHRFRSVDAVDLEAGGKQFACEQSAATANVKHAATCR
jgi:hypothetical protein